MFCTKCGVEINDESARFCSQCGAETGRGGAARPRTYERLSRPQDDKRIAGVCAGYARYLGVDVTLVRILMLILAIWPPGVGLIVYLISWIVMPKDPVYVGSTQPAGHPAN
jgi:phage shock protein C